MAEIETRTLDTTGATLRYDIRGGLTGGGAGHPVLFLIGSPMDAAGFATPASYFTDRAVVTYDPRGAGRSVRTDGAPETVCPVPAGRDAPCMEQTVRAATDNQDRTAGRAM
ncbi:hypothetical protein [Streptomyces xantholiticus]